MSSTEPGSAIRQPPRPTCLSPVAGNDQPCPAALSADIEEEIRAEGERWEKVVAENQAAQAALEEATARTLAAQGELARTAAEAGRVRARLDYLLGVRAILQGKSLDPEHAVKITVQYSREQEGRK